jgi:invasion protein IalB
MSIRRFAAYFFAISAGSTVAFASTLMGQPAPAEATEAETLSASSAEHAEHTVWLFPTPPGQSRHRPAAKITQVALGESRGR